MVSNNLLMVNLPRNHMVNVSEFSTIIWFHDNSKMYNNIFFLFKGKIKKINTAKLIPLKWEGLNIQNESYKLEKKADSIQYQIIERLKAILITK